MVKHQGIHAPGLSLRPFEERDAAQFAQPFVSRCKPLARGYLGATLVGLHRIEIVVAVGNGAERRGRPKSRGRVGVCCEEQVATLRPACRGERLLAGAGG